MTHSDDSLVPTILRDAEHMTHHLMLLTNLLLLGSIVRSSDAVNETAKNLVAGSAGGVALVYSGQPLDRAKVLLQTAPDQYGNSTLNCLRTVYRRGGVRGLYAGATASLSAEVGANIVMYASYQAAKKAFIERGVDPDMAAVLAGGVSGVLVSSVYGPLDLLKIRMQTADRPYASALQCAKDIVRREGPTALMNGLSATLARNIPQIMMYYYAYDKARSEMSLDPLLAGAIAGVACWCVGLPLDTVKSRIQAAPAGTTMLDCSRDILKKDGVAGFFRGWQPVMMRAALVNACCFKAIEATKTTIECMEGSSE